MTDKSLFEICVIARIYKESIARIETYEQRVKAGKDLNEALDFARYILQSGLPGLCRQFAQPDPIKIDGSHLQWRAEELQRNVREWWTTNKKPIADETQLEAINRKLDAIAGQIQRCTRIAIACSGLFSGALLAGPVEDVQARLEKINRNPPITWKTNATEIQGVIHCQNTEERRDVYSALRGVPALAMSSTSDPPAVSILMVWDPAKYQIKQEVILMADTLKKFEVKVDGKVRQKTPDGLLVYNDDDKHVYLVVDAPSRLIDDDDFSYTCYLIGPEFTYQMAGGGSKTVRRLTYSYSAADDYWEVAVRERVKRETDIRTNLK